MSKGLSEAKFRVLVVRTGCKAVMQLSKPLRKERRRWCLAMTTRRRSVVNRGREKEAFDIRFADWFVPSILLLISSCIRSNSTNANREGTLAHSIVRITCNQHHPCKGRSGASFPLSCEGKCTDGRKSHGPTFILFTMLLPIC